MLSLDIERSNKFKLALRIGFPILLLISLILFIIFSEGGLTLTNFTILILTVFIIIYFIFFMIYEGLSQNILDPISKAFNREAIVKILQKNLNKNDPYSIILISVDNLSDINERYGVENGDKVLEKIAFIIDDFFKKKYKKNIPIGHYKGGEFLIGISDKEENLKKLIDEFIKKYDKTKINDIEVKLFAAISDKSYSKDIKKIIEYLYELYSNYLYRPVSKRVYIAKKKNIEANEFEKFIIETIENKNISIRFQPALNLKTKKYDLVEIIVKLIDNNGSIIHPSQFIPVVNRLGFEKKFDLLLIEKILETIEKKSLPLNIFYSFNVSPFSIRDRNFSNRVFDIFSKTNIPKDIIVLELFENRLYKDIRYYKHVIDLYKKEGFKIAFDNFGSLNASIEYIKEIKADFIHFDKYFTKMIDNEIYFNLLKYWIEFFESINTKTVVKFIDNKDYIKLFESLGADYIEGYAVAKPMDADELFTFLEEKR
ncbi:bifunctional diguanylate cyclase/phosphodiesterase [Nitrosophilus kaiyonis]|uniref:bifunctional diguanylate cyclase/phosphodiesterase n=1 Tax=Nitrosophilus kaiyonis TaxID=2930200 RepID=UPI002490D3E6|nr:GGDEF domain-containing protein [Nitrosophilus kaiyonis]